MPGKLPDTPLTLLEKLRDPDSPVWQHSWRVFFELYFPALEAMAVAIYRQHANGAIPSEAEVKDTISLVMIDFFRKAQHRYDPAKGRLRTFLRTLTNARVIDRLRRQRPQDDQGVDIEVVPALPTESEEERHAYRLSLLANLIDEVRRLAPVRQFEIFERVKLHQQAPDAVAAELRVSRGVIDNSVYKVMKLLRELAQKPEYQEELNDTR